jgi:hypothetical protein
MAFDPSSDNPGWLNPGPRGDGPVGASSYPDYWTDPFINPRPTAPNPVASAPAPFSAAQLGAMAWHPPIFLPPNPFSPENIPASVWLTPPPIFLNSPGQFPPAAPPPANDPPIDPSQGLLAGIVKLAASAPMNAPPIDGLLGAIGRLQTANTEALPSILGAIARLPSAAPTSVDNPSGLFSRGPLVPLAGGPLPYPLGSETEPPSRFASGFFSAGARPAVVPMPGMPSVASTGGLPAPESLFPSFAQLQSKFVASDPALDPSSSLPVSPPDGSATPVPPTRSVLFNHSPATWDTGASDRDQANLDQTAQGLGASGLPISKSGAPLAPLPPVLSTAREQALYAAQLLSPNLVDYFTKTLPPSPPFPSTPGKIPSLDNPYALGAAFEAATSLLPEDRIVGPVAGAAEKSAAQAAVQAAKSAAGSPGLPRAAEQIAAGPYGNLGGTLAPDALVRIAAALRAAVDSGSLTREQAAVLLQRANPAGEGAAARLNGPLSAWLPKYDDETTYGVLITNEGNVVPLQSGPPRSFVNYPPSKHVEGKGAIWIRENGSSGGVLYHNNTDGTCGFCNAQLERLLPSNAALDVVPPTNAVPKNAKAMAGPTWYVGDSTMPKPPRPIRQPDLFGARQ